MSDLPIIQPEVTCEGCGACCVHIGYPPFVGMFSYERKKGDPEWLALPHVLAAEARQGAVDGRGEAELPCVWFDETTRKCRHYELRPTVCRVFEVGGPACLAWRSAEGVK